MQHTLPSPYVIKSNALARAQWSTQSVLEPRMVAIVASKVRQEDEDFCVYEVPVAEVLGRSHGGKDYTDIEQVVDKAMSRVLTIKSSDGWIKYNLFSRCRFRKADNILELGFHPDLKEQYLGLQKRFTKYSLMEFMMLPSVYSQRIYEILRSWDDQPEITISLEDLTAMLKVPESLKTHYMNFKARVLIKAHKDIHKYTTLRYEWEPVYKGRKVIAIRFIFSKKRIALSADNTNKAKHSKKKDLLDAAIACFKENGICPTPSIVGAKCSICREIGPMA